MGALTGLLYLILSMQHAGKCTGDMAVGCFASETHTKVPFDVPPVEREETVEYGSIANGDELHIVCKDLATGSCTYTRKVPSCSDKSRFLLMSEDGKWHCLALGQR